MLCLTARQSDGDEDGGGEKRVGKGGIMDEISCEKGRN